MQPQGQLKLGRSESKGGGINVDLIIRCGRCTVLTPVISSHPYLPASAVLTLAMSDNSIRRRNSSASFDPHGVPGKSHEFRCPPALVLCASDTGTAGETGGDRETVGQTATLETGGYRTPSFQHAG
jgi:hypothetical protein